jgi:hypothetical protein
MQYGRSSGVVLNVPHGFRPSSMNNTFGDPKNKIDIAVAPIKLQFVVNNSEQDESLGMSRWRFVVAQAVDDGSYITGAFGGGVDGKKHRWKLLALETQPCCPFLGLAGKDASLSGLHSLWDTYNSFDTLQSRMDFNDQPTFCQNNVGFQPCRLEETP